MAPVTARRPVRSRASVSSILAIWLVVAAATGSVLASGPEAAEAQVMGDQRYRPPLDAPITDPFRPPAVPWGPGNRGIEYGTEAGTLIRAIGPGVVSFAGPVAGTLHVTVTHPDGLRSSYSGVAAVRTSVGEVVSGGEVVAVAGTTFHLGVRDGDRYIDPSALWGLSVASGPVVLVPVEEPPRPSGLGTAHRRALREITLREVALRFLAGVGVGPWVS